MASSFSRSLAIILLFIGIAGAAQAQPIPLTSATYRQNFDSLSNSDGSLTFNTLPTGWMLVETGGGSLDDERYAVDRGISQVGDTYSYGATGSTDRALGGLRTSSVATVFGTCFRNYMSAPLTEFTMGYTGEHWRLGTAGRTDSLVFEYSLDSASLTSGTWHPITALDFTTPNTSGGAGPRDGNSPGNRRQRSAAVGALVAGGLPPGDTFCIRWSDSDASGADDGLAVDDFWITAGPTSLPTITVSDESRLEGNAGATNLLFYVLLSKPAGEGGVTFNVRTSDGSALAGSDYQAINATGITIPAGGRLATVSAAINGDTTIEPDETLFFNIDSVSGAAVGDAQAVGTIQNDDFPLVQIHDIQGSGLTSPLNGTVVATEGIVTAQKAIGGFFLQTADADVDADPDSSQGIFVSTASAPPAAATVGNRIRVTGAVTELLPSTSLNQLTITQIGSVRSIQELSTGNPLPHPVALNDADFGPSALPGTAEKYEGMRVSVASARTISGTDGSISESTASASTTGTFHIALNGVARPFREPGISVLDRSPLPSGKTPPRFDTNPERLAVHGRGQAGTVAIAADADAMVQVGAGVLDYASGTWTILPDPGAMIVAGGKTATPVSDARYEDVTIGGINLMRFYDDVDDGNGGPTLSQAALDTRVGKASLAICDYLKAPDILGVVEVENVRVLGLLADRINSECTRAPQYVPFLIQGNDPGGMNVGFLISNRMVGTGTRVEVAELTQYGRNSFLANPDGSASPLYEHPPLMLRARVHHDNGAIYPVTVIANDLRSIQGIDDGSGGSSGWTTEGHRVRAKRGQQALFLAELVQSMQTADRDEHIVLLGDFNAFEFNDGYVDVMGIVRGNEVPAEEVVHDLESPIETPLVDASDLITDAAGKYSYVLDGNAQMLDHVVLNEALVMDAGDINVEYARINADFGAHHHGVADNAIRVSDRDPVRVAISVAAFRSADLAVSASAMDDEARMGGIVIHSVIVDNVGPNDAGSASLRLTFDAPVSPVVVAPAGWTCAAPLASTIDTTLTCTTASFANAAKAIFSISTATDPLRRDRALHMHAAIASSVADPANGNNQTMVAVRMFALADLSVVASNGGDVVGTSKARFIANVENHGPDLVSYASVALVFDKLLESVSVTASAGWRCTDGVRNLFDSTTTVTCVSNDFPSGEKAAITADITAPYAGHDLDWSLAMAAATTSFDRDPEPGNNQSLTSLVFRRSTDLGEDTVDAIDPSVQVNGEGKRKGTRVLAVRNNDRRTIVAPRLTIVGDAPARNVTIVPAANWTCTEVATSHGFRQDCHSTLAMPAGGEAPFTLSVASSGSRDTSISASIAPGAGTADRNPANNAVRLVLHGRARPMLRPGSAARRAKLLNE